MNDADYRIRTMTRPEIDTAVDWAADEGWNPGLHDADCFHAADPNGFLTGMLGERPVASISVVRYGERFGFLGFYIVHPQYRGRGFGLRIWNAGLDYLAGRTVGLDGVVDQQPNYRKSGFDLLHRNIRYQGTGGGNAPGDDGIVPLSSLDTGSIVDYDRQFFADDRARFLECWTGQPSHTALAVVRGGELRGYGVLRPCRSGCKIGPLFADDAREADRLFRALAARAAPGEPVFLDVPETNPEAVALAGRHGMTVVFETARMYRGEAPDLPLERTFGITTFELG